MIIVGLLIFLLVVVGIVGMIGRAVVRRVRSSDAPVARNLGGLLLTITVAVSVNAISSIIELLFPADELFFDSSRSVALNVATLIVAVPVAVVMWRTLFAGRDDFPRRFAILSGLAVSMWITLFSLVNVGRAALGVADFRPASLANLIAFGLAWIAYEWFIAREHGTFEIDDLRPTVGSLAGFVLTVGSLILVFETALASIIGSSGSVIFDQSPTDAISNAAVLGVIGLPVSVSFWLLQLARSNTRFRYGYAAAIAFQSVLAAAWSLGVTIALSVDWMLGLSDNAARDHFGPVRYALPVLAVAALSAIHHRSVLGARRGLAVRAYSYGLAANGLLTAAGGVSVLIATGIGSVTSVALVESQEYGSIVVAATTAFFIGGMLWWRHWSRVDGSEVSERDSSPRRLYLVGLLTIAGSTAAVSLIVALFGLLRALLDSDFSLDTVYDGRYVVALVVTSVPIAIHLIGLLAADRDGRPVGVQREALVVCSDPGALAGREGVEILARADALGDVSDELVVEIDQLLSVAGHPLVITVEDDSIRWVEVTSI